MGGVEPYLAAPKTQNHHNLDKQYTVDHALHHILCSHTCFRCTLAQPHVVTHSFIHSFVTSHSNTNTARGGVSVTRVTQACACSPLRKKCCAGPGRGFRSASLRPLRPGCRLPPVLPLLLRVPWTAGAERGPHFVRVGRFWSIALLVPNASVTQKYCSSQVTVQHEVCRLHPQRAVRSPSVPTDILPRGSFVSAKIHRQIPSRR